MTYKIREFVKGGKSTFEIWTHQQTTKRTWWGFAKSAWKKVTEFKTLEAAEKYLSNETGGYYNEERDYDENGKPIYYGY